MSPGLHARRATGLTVAEREETFNWTESLVRGSRGGRAAFEAERALLFCFVFSLLAGARRSNQARNRHMRGDGDVFVYDVLINLHCSCGTAVPYCDFSFVHKDCS